MLNSHADMRQEVIQLEDINQDIKGFITAAIKQQMVAELDAVYLQNRVFALMQSVGYQLSQPVLLADDDLLGYMDKLLDDVVACGLISAHSFQHEQLEAMLMDVVTPLPSVVNARFWADYQTNPEQATAYFYQLSQNTNYIKTREISQNVRFTYAGRYGELQITINRAKPEKDPKEIAAQPTDKTTPGAYPKCALCIENEGFKGSATQAARQNHRLIRFEIGDSPYYLQYSPYSYYNAHCIFINEAHVPMVINHSTFINLLVIVELLPHYFVGSNADLPIVGGSILAHDHYQGGQHTFPMENAQAFYSKKIGQYAGMTLELLTWPLSVIRLRHSDRNELAAMAITIYNQWLAHSDVAHGIIARTGQERHHTITPIARRRGQQFELDLVLRDNRTSAEHPEGIFHPHRHLHHIKKENIGLIEVMGLAILPPRLEGELEAIKAYLSGRATLADIPDYHWEWTNDLATKWQNQPQPDWNKILQAEIGQKFEEILEHAGVFKMTESGQTAFVRFIDSLGE